MGHWRAQAAKVSIVRDDWGIAHVKGKTDADAVFGMAYAQAEDDFNRVETNYLSNLGRTAEAEGAGAIWADLRAKLYVSPERLQADYARSPAWLRALMDAWADGLNFYLATHPEVKPRVIARFEPWMALSFTEGSIGGDIERISLRELEAFYGGTRSATLEDPYAFREPTGSNGIAIGPKITKDGHALLLINPHTSFFFRSELQMTSEEGLNAYGAVTWGQFFIYQGFNAHTGWMHTSSGVDVVDEFAETIIRTPGTLMYRYGKEARPVTTETIVVPFKGADGTMQRRSFTVYRTHHGPIVRAAGDKWIAFSMMNKPVEALQQSFLRTKQTDLATFLKVADTFKANSSNNTLFADDKGETAYLHPQFIPKRDDRFDYTQPVDGSNPAADWQGLHAFAETPRVISPGVGWVYNTNDWPYAAAGPESPKQADFPKYMDSAGANPRGPHAVRVLQGRKDFTLQSLVTAAYDPYLTAFAQLIPTLTKAYDAAPAGDPSKVKLAGQIAALKAWDFKWSTGSTETSLAVFWGEALWANAAPTAKAAGMSVWDYMATRSTDAERLAALGEASDRLTADFGTWKTPWGEINRFQRLNGDIVQAFRDDGPSTPVGFTSSRWGSLASFGAQRYPGTKRYYGTSGNSFVAAVEFGPKVRAVAVTAGGESGHPANPHFLDQVQRYADGKLREVYFYPEQLTGHTERTYRPGD
ncbi:MAG: penicillin acylase family protein [Alphaproteobacteria bacterium]|nr:penicillin acylase family protein [Alphaproteobacteria bacterium]MBU1513840.1 penicillin acylase family protein [Alphaproteobacteria bacterium]MBU2094515.1 penicillin acylase family protein [Alphaproteobacteria bacterium]MBU2151224.1 penicillin acylase family protein [Alphaproteobacteria bacterium]MBU2310039.1 penicillin acylase family protein [Alphaproteobacteria bacterium]